MQTGDFSLVFIVWPLESSLYLTVVRFKQSLCKTANWITFLVCCLILKHPPGDFKGFSGSTDIKRSSVWSVSVFVTHLTRFYKHTRYINDWAELHCSDVCSQHICLPLLHFFQTLCLIHLALNPSSYNQIILKSLSVMSSVLTGIARSTSGRLRRPERGEATSHTGTGSGKCSHSHAGLLLFFFAIHRSVVFQKAVHPIRH